MAGDVSRGAVGRPSLTFTEIATTRVLCPGEPLGEQYLSHLGYVRSWLIEDGRLYLSLMADGGIMQFRSAGENSWRPVAAGATVRQD